MGFYDMMFYIMETLRIISWNVNGIRALHRKGFFKDIFSYDADIICLQETKAERGQLPEEITNPSGYTSWFHSTSQRKGHSGTAVYSRIEPSEVTRGFPQPWSNMDQQGRTMTLFIDDYETPIALINCYFPNGGSKSSPLDYKLAFYETMLAYVQDLKSQGYHVIITGDWNVAHHSIDLARPQQNKKSIGFLPEERAWLDHFEDNGWVDIWRYEHPDQINAYTWWDMKSRARDRNVGWRIDYFFIPQEMIESVLSTTILISQYGSDHCPILFEYTLS